MGMGLISEYVEVTLCGKNIEYYEKLGYEIPRYYNELSKRYSVKNGTKIKVKVSDLPKYSNVKVDVQCNHCNKIYELEYCNYTMRNHEGKVYCNNCKSKIFNSGENSNFWKGNSTQKDKEECRHIDGYYDFVRNVLARDKYTCVCCQKIGKKMEVHHLNGYNWFVEGRTDETNAVTLCKTCHKNFHMIYGQGDNTKEQFEEWLGKSIKDLQKFNGKLPTTRKIYCIEEDCIYSSVKTLARKWGITSPSLIYKACNYEKGTESLKSLRNKHLLWLDEYEQMTRNDIQEYLNECNKNERYHCVICITSGEIFTTITNASKKYNTKNIVGCCKGKIKHSGKLSDGTPLKWMYYEDFLKLPIEEQNEILSKNNESSTDGSFLLDKEAM